MVIVGALALVVVAGLVFVGAKTNGARPGALTTAGITCQDYAPMDRQTLSWTDNADTTGGTFTINYTVGRETGVATVSGVKANVQISRSFSSSLIDSWGFTITYTSNGTTQNYGSVTCD